MMLAENELPLFERPAAATALLNLRYYMYFVTVTAMLQ